MNFRLYKAVIFLLFLSLGPMLLGAPTIKKDWEERYFSRQQREVRKALLKEAAQDIKSEHSIVFTVIVLDDGWGDLGNFLQAVKIFKEKYPHWPMRAIIGLKRPAGNVPNDWFEQRKAKIPFNFEQAGLTEKEVLILPFSWAGIIWRAESQDAKDFQYLLEDIIKDEQEREKISPRLRDFANFFLEAELVVNISAFFGFTDKNKPLPNIFLSEYGEPYATYINPGLHKHERSFGMDLKNIIWKMGLGPDCLGIFNIKTKIADSFDSNILKKYYTDGGNNFFKYKGNTINFVQSILSIYPDLDFITIVTDDGLTGAKYALDPSQLEETRVVFIDKLGKENIISSPEQYRRQITFLDAFPLSNADFQRAISMAKAPVGVTGNVSFSEAIEHLPYYYAANHSLKEFYDQIIELAKATLDDADDLILYLKEVQKKGTGAQATPQSFPKIKAAWSLFSDLIRKHWDVKPFLIGLINKKISDLKRATVPPR